MSPYYFYVCNILFTILYWLEFLFIYFSVQLLHKLVIRSSDGNHKLMKVWLSLLIIIGFFISVGIYYEMLICNIYTYLLTYFKSVNHFSDFIVLFKSMIIIWNMTIVKIMNTNSKIDLNNNIYFTAIYEIV